MSRLPSNLILEDVIPTQWNSLSVASSKKPSAVLILLVNDAAATSEPASVILIQRGKNVGSHRGQIGFPGGRFETGDKTPADTALREAFEEIGISSTKIQILRELPVVQSIDGSDVHPVIGIINSSDLLINLNQNEVEKLYITPWINFKEDRCRQFRFNMFGHWRSSFLYDCEEFKVWGLSALILNQANFKED